MVRTVVSGGGVSDKRWAAGETDSARAAAAAAVDVSPHRVSSTAAHYPSPFLGKHTLTFLLVLSLSYPLLLAPSSTSLLSLTLSLSLSLSLSLTLFLTSLTLSVSLLTRSLSLSARASPLATARRCVYHTRAHYGTHRLARAAAHNNPAPGCSTHSVTVAARRLSHVHVPVARDDDAVRNR